MLLLNEIYSRIKLVSILIVIAYFVIASSKRLKVKGKVKVKHGPTGMSHDHSTNCSEFAKYGRFNPYSVIHAKWFVFYYWAPALPLTTYIFTAPSSNHTKKLKKLFEGNCVLPVQWGVRHLLMEDNNNYVHLLVERSDRGEYWQYPVARVRKNQKITPRDVRLKQTGDNRLLGILDCVADTFLVMARLNDVPPKARLHEEASRLGYRGTKGKSYLYQGHEWGPIEEGDEDAIFDRRKEKAISKDTSTDYKSSEESSEEVEQPTNELEYLKAKKPKPNKGAILPPVKPEDDETCVKVMPELWNDPQPNPNPDNLLTKEDLNYVDSLIINDTPAIEGPDNNDTPAIEGPDSNDTPAIEGPDSNDAPAIEGPERDQTSTDNKQENNVDKESEKLLENDKLHNHNDAHKMETPDPTDNKPESNPNKEFKNPSENQKLHIHNDAHKMETPDSTDNKPESNTDNDFKNSSDIQKQHSQRDIHKIETPDSTENKPESNINVESENLPKNDNPHNHKTCPESTEPDDDDETCVVCYKSQLSYVSDESYVPNSARSMPDLKDNEDAPPKEVQHVNVPHFKIGGIELPLEEQLRTEVPIPKVPSANTPRTEVPTPTVPSKSKSTRTEVPTPEVPSTKTAPTKVPTPNVPSAKSPRTEVPARSLAPPTEDQTNSSEIIYLTPKTLDELKNRNKQ